MKLTEKQKELITHLFEGGEIEYSQAIGYKLDCIGLKNATNVTLDVTPTTLLNTCTIYIHPLQKRINELEAELAKFKNTSIVAKHDPHKEHTHLTTAEVREIEEVLTTAKVIDKELIMATYNISVTTMNRIIKGTHSKSSLDFKFPTK